MNVKVSGAAETDAGSGSYRELDALLAANRTPTAAIGRTNQIRQTPAEGSITEAEAERLLKKYGLL